MTTKPVVSIVCIAFNQVVFIEDTLRGFLMQKTDFAFEVLIHDDASTDGTKQIVEKYANTYPDIIKPIYEAENQYSKGDYSFINATFQRSEGDYVAFCEGDDFWTDPEKLQIQVDFLERHTAYALCFHPVRVFFENNNHQETIFPSDNKDHRYTLEELLKHNYIQSNSTLYRRQTYENLPSNIIPSDWYMHLYHAQFGKIGFINKVMSAYRRHEGGVWWESQGENKDEFWVRHGKSHFALFAELLKLYGHNKRQRDIILLSVFWMFQVLTRIDSKYYTTIVNDTILAYPEIAEPYILTLQNAQKEAEAVVSSHKKHIKYLEASVALKDDEIKILSRSFKQKLADKISRKKQS